MTATGYTGPSVAIADVSGLQAILDGLQDDIDALGGGGGGGVAAVSGYVKTGDVTPQTTAVWAALTGGPTFAIAAVAGDLVELQWAALKQPTSGLYWDICVLVSGAPVRYASSGTGTAAIEGDPGQYPDSSFRPGATLGMALTCEAGDLSGGLVTFGVAVLNPSGGGKLFEGTNYPLRYRVANFGAQS